MGSGLRGRRGDERQATRHNRRQSRAAGVERSLVQAGHKPNATRPTEVRRAFALLAPAGAPTIRAPLSHRFPAMRFARKFDVLVTGGGQAGTEAALAAARMCAPA